MKFLILGLVLLVSYHVKAKIIEKCGVYDAEGYYTEIFSVPHKGIKKRVILLNRGTNSEIKFYLSNNDLSKRIPETHLGVNFKLKLKFTSKCWYHCEGSLEKVIEPLSPFSPVKSFVYPRPAPLSGTEVECKKNLIEKV